MKYLTTKTKRIEIHEVDYMSRYQLCQLFNELSNIATENAIEIGLWSLDMMGKYGWIVAKQSLHLTEPIYYNDLIEFSTIPGKGAHVAFPRYYFLKKDGRTIGTCSSIWTIIDMQKRRMTSPKRIGLTIPNIDHDIILEEPHNISIDIEMSHVMTRQVLYSDVDTNQHMNNTRYIQWALDCLDYSIHKDSYISDITLQYKKEIRPLEYVELYVGQHDNRYIVEGKNSETTFFIIEILMTKTQ